MCKNISSKEKEKVDIRTKYVYYIRKGGLSEKSISKYRKERDI